MNGRYAFRIKDAGLLGGAGASAAPPPSSRAIQQHRAAQQQQVEHMTLSASEYVVV